MIHLQEATLELLKTRSAEAHEALDAMIRDTIGDERCPQDPMQARALLIMAILAAKNADGVNDAAVTMMLVEAAFMIRDLRIELAEAQCSRSA